MKTLVLAMALLTLASSAAYQSATAAPAGAKGVGKTSAPAESRLTRGQAVFRHWCTPCHGKGLNMPGTTALDAKYLGKLPAALEDRTDLDAAAIGYFVRNGVSIMPTFRKTEISDAELADLSLYLGRKRRD